jgi:transcriptional regulator with GAF, ATPase, and Fis domain
MVQLPYTFTKRIKEQNADIKQLILDALNQSDNDLSEASRLLGIKRQSLQYHMEKNGITVKRCTKILIKGELPETKEPA